MTPENNESQSEHTELREKIAALDAGLIENFKAQFVVSPFLSRKIVSFQWACMGAFHFGNAYMSGEKIMPYLRHLSSSSDFITTPEEIRSGFVALALERSRRATPFVEQARALKVTAMRVNHLGLAEILKFEIFRQKLYNARSIVWLGIRSVSLEAAPATHRIVLGNNAMTLQQKWQGR